MKRLFSLMLVMLAIMMPAKLWAQEPYAVLTKDTLVTFYYDDQKLSRNGINILEDVTGIHPSWDVFVLQKGYYITTIVFDTSFAKCNSIKSTADWFCYCRNLTSIIGIQYLKTDNVTDMSNMFKACSSLTSLDLSGFNTANVTNMSNMFEGCSSLTSLNLNGFKNDNVTDMSNMFEGCSSLTSLDLSGFNTANVTRMAYMFNGCSGLTSLDLSNFKTDNVTNMFYMFAGCSGLTSLDVSGFNTANVTSMSDMFNGCSSLTSLDLSNFNTANVTDMGGVFNGCSSLTSLDLSGFNTANVTNMSHMFEGCSRLTSLDVSGFNTTNVTYMGSMFSGCSRLTSLDVSSFKTDNVTSMGSMFSGCSGLTSLDVSNFKTDNVTNMYKMFYRCSSLTSLDVSNFKTDNVTDMGFMFLNCSGLTNLDVSGLKTDKVTGMPYMFSGCSGLTNLDVSHFNTANVTSINSMFEDCPALTSLDVSGFKTNNVTAMTRMFYGCSNLTSLDVSHFNTDNVTSLSEMFSGCSGLTSLDLSGFKTDNVRDMSSMFSGCSGLTTIYAGIGWSTEAVRQGWWMFDGSTKLVGGAGTTYDKSHTDYTYAHIDGGPDNPGYFTRSGDAPVAEPEPYAVLSEDSTVLTFYYDEKKAERNGMGVGPFESNVSRMWFNQKEQITTVVFDDSFANCTTLTSTDYWFDQCRNLVTFSGMSNLKTDNVTRMAYMFNYCSSLTSLDVSHFNTANVTSMSHMFLGCSNLTNLDVSNFKTDNVTSMYSMFLGCTELTSLDLSGFKTDNLISMHDMFYGCSALKSLDMSNFNTKNVTDMSKMFCRCFDLKTIFVGSEWSTASIKEDTDMFKDCTSLVGGKGTAYDSLHVDATYAHIDGGPDNPGYFTRSGDAPYVIPTSTVVSLINNGNMEGEDNSSFLVRYPTNNGDIIAAAISDGVGVDGTRGIKIEATAKEYYGHDNQFWFHLNQPVSIGTKFRLEFDYRADTRASVRTEMHAAPCEYLGDTDFRPTSNFGTDWNHFSYEGTLPAGNYTLSEDNHTTLLPFQSLAFNLNIYEGANNYYFDNVKFEVVLEDQCPMPTFTRSGNKLSIQSPFNATIYYTVDGSEPTTSSKIYNGLIDLNNIYIVKAIAVVEGYESSSVASYYAGVELVSNNDMEAEDNNSYFVRIDAGEINQAVISDGVGIKGSRGIKVEATAMKSKSTDNQFWFRLNKPVSAGTKFYVAFDYRADTSADMNCEMHAEPGEYISESLVSPYRFTGWQHTYYEGTMPASSSSDQLPFQSFAFCLNKYEGANNYYFDNVKFEVYLEDQCPKPTFWKKDNTVKIESPFNATIYYTLDGSTPTTGSSVYSSPLTFKQDVKINAIAVVEGYEVSHVATYNFTYEASVDDVTFSTDGVLTAGGGITMKDALEVVGGREEVAKTITAIVWNSSAALTNSDLQGLDNPNMLIFVKDGSQAPDRDNVIINGRAKTIVLTDTKEGNGNFCCPQAFTAEKVSYTREFLQETQVGVSRGWESLALPFTVQTITHEKQGEIAPFGNSTSTKHFWLRRLGNGGLTQATSIEANVPYIISMPNDSENYAEAFNLAGRVTFVAQEVTIPVTEPVTLALADSTIKMVPAFQSVVRSSDVWAINVGETRGQYFEGSVFERDYREVRPFEAYTVHTSDGPAPRFVPIREIGGATGIEDVRGLMYDGRGDSWYDLNGRRLLQKPTQKGVYMNNGRKVIIR